MPKVLFVVRTRASSGGSIEGYCGFPIWQGQQAPSPYPIMFHIMNINVPAVLVLPHSTQLLNMQVQIVCWPCQMGNLQHPSMDQNRDGVPAITSIERYK